MDLSSQEGDIPIPINTSYGGVHGHNMIHHDHHPHHHQNNILVPQIPSSNGPIPTSIAPPITTTALDLDHYKKLPPVVRYRECLKNHAAAMGGNATDGCGEFMPSGEEGTIEALTCSACNCHRNFHRKEVEGEPSPYDQYLNYRVGRKLLLGHHHHHHHKSLMGPEGLGYPTAGTLIRPQAPAHQMIVPYSIGSIPSESDDQEDGIGGGGGGYVVARPPHMVKKRFRTKFTPEQKEKMLNFAEKVGWKIQKQDEAVVQEFCQEIGVRRRVLKVWMHNNKHNLAKNKNLQPPSSIPPQNPI